MDSITVAATGSVTARVAKELIKVFLLSKSPGAPARDSKLLNILFKIVVKPLSAVARILQPTSIVYPSD